MPKLKRNKGAVKRFRLTRRGKAIRRKAGHGHLLAGKSKKRKRKLRQPTTCQPGDTVRVKKLLSQMG